MFGVSEYRNVGFLGPTAANEYANVRQGVEGYVRYVRGMWIRIDCIRIHKMVFFMFRLEKYNFLRNTCWLNSAFPSFYRVRNWNPDPRTQMNPDTNGSGSISLHKSHFKPLRWRGAYIRITLYRNYTGLNAFVPTLRDGE